MWQGYDAHLGIFTTRGHRGEKIKLIFRSNVLCLLINEDLKFLEHQIFSTLATILDFKMAAKLWIEDTVKNGLLIHILFWQIFQEHD